ncbi:tetraacyldisaccharide 4'-kinase [uncultured Candidatus Pelagibacter sp.]|uniref:tetraacyldisaccharide 4'-kinase n=1 Tax=uncultured Candidatus Pelagibacter sp. TaxID=372654 RepID=UPI00262453E9|nr:tetraacyldisaccharide 4'-kinase [uncultured Candidatus Pelagibacter sp.]
MKLIKPKFWETKNFISLILYPFSAITFLINSIKKFSIKKTFEIKTICIGNIFIGGTGKTSLAIEINELLRKKFRTVFIKKNYENQMDEMNLLKNRGKIISSSKRENALSAASKKKYQVAILDDGLQQKNINYDLKIACFNSKYALGNEYMLPAGPLRENLNVIKNYDLIFLSGEKKNKKLLLKLKSINKNLQIFEGKYKPLNLKKFNLRKKYLMFCGIGNPHEFEQTLVKSKFNISKKIIFPDHHKFSNIDLKKLKYNASRDNLTLVTTEKDFFRLNKAQRKNIKFLKIKLEIKDKEKLKKILISKL